jgi:hypothetical protein
MPFELVRGKRPTISHVKLFRGTCYIHIREEKCSSRTQYHPCAPKVLIISYTSSPKVDLVVRLEDEYCVTTWDMTFPKKSSPQVAPTRRRIFQDPQPDL